MESNQHQTPPNSKKGTAPLHASAASPQAGQAVPNPILQQPKTPIPQSPAPANHSHRHGSAMSTPSPQMPQSPDPVHDLPAELLEAGWRQFWSKREGRNYYFNKFTQNSLWEMPTIDRGASRHDPLGIQTDHRPAHPHPQPHPNLPSPLGMMPRRHSLEESPVSPTIKMADLKGPFWDFTVNTNAMMFERYPSRLPPPHNDIEQMRGNLVQKLRFQYNELCQQREGVSAPRESFNRWLLERKVIDKGTDPMLPSKCSPEVSPSMKREIMSDIPIRLHRPKVFSEAKKLLYNYAEAAKKLIESRKATPESRKIIKWNVDEMFRWLRTGQSCTIDEFMKRLAHLKEQCGPHLSAAVQSSVEGICTKMYHMSCEIVKKLRDRHWEVLKEHQIEEPAPFTRPPQDKKMPCYSVYAIVPSPRLPTVDIHEEGATTCIRYNGEMMKINTAHLKKLELLYRLHINDDRLRYNFLPRVWCLLRRYQTLFGVGQYEGHGLQGALPVNVFKSLHDNFGVTFECFASPLNCYFKQFCSAFADTDCYFGSRGPVLDFHPVSGSFEANPPFGEELMEAMVAHFERLLANTTDPLSFIVFIPEWRNPPTAALVNMEQSRFKRRQETVSAYEHEYRSGGQHACSEDDINYRAVHGTAIFFLQNEAGYQKWTPTNEKIQAMMDAYRPQKRALDSEAEDGPPRKKLATERGPVNKSTPSVDSPHYRPKAQKRSLDAETGDDPQRKKRVVEDSPSNSASNRVSEDNDPRHRRKMGADASLVMPLGGSTHDRPLGGHRDRTNNDQRPGRDGNHQGDLHGDYASSSRPDTRIVK
ncbi:mRNA (2'-O-methyladenosine-N(6)-)-methyltransferase-like [Patiria miniata]|uniref:WW domain-containing protein n=1 Tax=Patiria miniata TaxID=46514 RepID=A0A914B319_PATMI|nr:mRNA (2'-O-methyladenosine-N(6)-)-methyltransferase-like [Patiria miniata]XP_038070203.1 mRNA (2'-O-methyladenosine-N(6)-)-methyltransferase-like [Patiria miniata]XP_038070204.1 mRNA (2'-O-methyladenosine-N(6)-)-methyltransferase-like [Patiria miniata]